ncbi:MAG: hypothetical protein RLY31_1883 [Bacteroidota bacterium]
MRNTMICLGLLLTGCSGVVRKPAAVPAHPAATDRSIAGRLAGMTSHPGFLPLHIDERDGKIWWSVERTEEEFLFVESLSAGIGSNDIGLDRGQLGRNRIVRFERSGNKLLLVQANYDYRAVTDNDSERQAVREAFAQSVLWGFPIEREENGVFLVDATKFLLQDHHDVITTLKRKGQGSYRLDESRSALYLPRTRNFPDNSEMEVTLTFTGTPEGKWIGSVTPSPAAVTVRQHCSFVRLPDDGFSPRRYDPRSGYFATSYHDYATPMEAPLVQRLINRHRLQKKDPGAAMSDPVDPIVYYLDPGTPEPVRSALLEGASWWNQAFESAGYRDAFQVRMLPEDADPMDIRYNLIQWVHRSTRGWSYGSSVVDPRTGEIIKGKVTLGSLRVRQDYLIAQGLLAAYEEGRPVDPRLQEMALARLRQLSAHEVGHTLGLAHNYAASADQRASVMDYPHPYITLDEQGAVDFSAAYASGIGEWDRRAILYGYQDFPEGVDEAAALEDILVENRQLGLHYLSDQDARPVGSAHPMAHLWDNGSDPVAELRRIMAVRQAVLAGFGPDHLAPGRPLAELERILVPLYLAHRYQAEAVAKLVGGVTYSYTVKGFETDAGSDWLVRPVGRRQQEAALDALLETLDAGFLEIPAAVRAVIPPQPVGFGRDEETFPSRTGLVFDPLSAATVAAVSTVRVLLHPERLARLVRQEADDPQQMGVVTVLRRLLSKVVHNTRENPYQAEIAREVEKQVVFHLIGLSLEPKGDLQVAALVSSELERYAAEAAQRLATAETEADRAHWKYLSRAVVTSGSNPEDFRLPAVPVPPPGAPIGCGDR